MKWIDDRSGQIKIFHRSTQTCPGPARAQPSAPCLNLVLKVKLLPNAAHPRYKNFLPLARCEFLHIDHVLENMSQAV